MHVKLVPKQLELAHKKQLVFDVETKPSIPIQSQFNSGDSRTKQIWETLFEVSHGILNYCYLLYTSKVSTTITQKLAYKCQFLI